MCKLGLMPEGLLRKGVGPALDACEWRAPVFLADGKKSLGTRCAERDDLMTSSSEFWVAW